MESCLFKKFGFSGSSEFFKNFGDGVGKGLFIICATFGSVLLSVGGSFAGGYIFSTNWAAASGIWQSAWVLIYNPITALISGCLLLIFGAIGAFLDQDQQGKLMLELRIENKKFKATKSALNSAQEELQESKPCVST